MPQQYPGNIAQVSTGIYCQDFREPLGVVSCIVPFNFPVMVPMWTVPIALTAGNCVILKPSEKVPMTMRLVAELLTQAGVPPGVFNMVQGTAEVVNTLCDHPRIPAVTFVGSSRVAELVAQRCRALNKRVLALGGAKNHLVALPDCDAAACARDIVASFAGCAGQRCMAASVLLLVGEQPKLLEQVCELAKKLKPGQKDGEMGPVIDGASKLRITSAIAAAEARGGKVLVDGRTWAESAELKAGTWVGPTVIVTPDKSDPILQEEVFGPVISVLTVNSWEEALAIENANDYGNAACIYTSVGSHADWFAHRFKAGMIGVNVGVPVPREPFSFGGLYPSKSKYGDLDITGPGAMDFFSTKRKITTKWGALQPGVPVHATNGTPEATDKANFAGQM